MLDMPDAGPYHEALDDASRFNSGETSMLTGERSEPDPCVVIVFGASGDLFQRKVGPAIYNLAREGRLSEKAAFIGFGRTEFSDEAFREHLRESLNAYSRETPVEEDVWQELARRFFYQQGSYDDACAHEALAERVAEVDEQFQVGGGRLHYLAIPPHLVENIVTHLHQVGLLERRSPVQEQEQGAMRVVLEKPFGRDLESARELNQILDHQLEESQIFRMDHYLGKETVQNLLVLRFANAILEPVWNSRYVRHVHVTVAENDGIGSRAGYFESAGALRDVMQNHVLQLLALFTMEAPASLEADAIRDEKAKVLRCLRRFEEEDLHCSVVRGQYGRGEVDGEEVCSYREEEGVDPQSSMETFVALRTYIDNWRWSGVPFYLATGKRLPVKLTEVAVEFKEVPQVLFGANGEGGLETNLLKIRVQPDENVMLRMNTKIPGMALKSRAAEMNFPYGSVYGSASPEAYERLVLDAMAGNATLFTRRDEIELAWDFVDPILNYWDRTDPPVFPNYESGTWGPISGSDFFREDTCYSRVMRSEMEHG
jgi:glucose-6-phosphate 1-dehydrogenase